MLGWALKQASKKHAHHYVRTFIVLWSEIPSGICAKLRTVAASNNRVHMPWSLYYCFSCHIYLWCCSSRTSRSWWITHSTQHHRRGCNNSSGGSRIIFLPERSSICQYPCKMSAINAKKQSRARLLLTHPVLYILKIQKTYGAFWKPPFQNRPESVRP